MRDQRVPILYRTRLWIGRLLLATAAIGFFGIVARQAGAPMLTLWERGHSMPPGVYVLDHLPPARRGEVVVLSGAPRWPGGYLLKRVEGVAGDRYCWDARAGTQRLNGRLMPKRTPHARKHRIEPWRGCTTLGRDEYVGYGLSPDSYDSRFFGPVPEAALEGVYRRVLGSLPAGGRED